MKLNYKLPLIATFLAGSLLGYSQAQDTIQSKDKKETFNFLERSYIKIKSPKWHKPDFSKLEDLAKIKNNGKRAYKLKDLIFLERGDISKDYAGLISEKNGTGENIFASSDIHFLWHVRDRSHFLEDGLKRQSSRDIIEILKYRNEEGEPIFSTEDIMTYLSYEIDLKNLINNIDSIKSENPKEIAKEFYRKKIENDLKDWGFGSILEFYDTKKPNALLVWPYSDWNGGFLLEDNELSDFSISNFKKFYDIKLSLVEKEEEIYSAIKEMPNTELLLIRGHGTKTSLSFGDPDKIIFESEKNEEYALDLSDKEFQNYLDMLDTNARIILYSCENAKENIFNKKNLAKFISIMAGNKEVFAWGESLFDIFVKINQYYPFELAKGYQKEICYVNGEKRELKRYMK